jgi:Protein of unknown function (DUF1207)
MSMKMRFLFAMLVALAAGAARAESFPKGELFAPLIADPNETRTFVSLFSVDSETVQSWLGYVGVGANFGLYRWAGKQPGDASQLGVFAAINSLFDMEETSYPLVNTDYRVGFTYELQRGQFSARTRLFHQSSHLGDELILQGNAPQRVNLSVEVVDLLIAWQRAGWRPYIGGMYIFHRDPEDLKQAGFQVGVDYTGTAPVLFGGRLVGGVDYRAFEENDWRGGMSVKVGLEYGRPRPERRGIKVLLEYYDGAAPFGQFYNDVVSYYGLGVQFDY